MAVYNMGAFRRIFILLSFLILIRTAGDRAPVLLRHPLLDAQSLQGLRVTDTLSGSGLWRVHVSLLWACMGNAYHQPGAC